jgi:hypothetical protein
MSDDWRNVPRVVPALGNIAFIHRTPCQILAESSPLIALLGLFYLHLGLFKLIGVPI